MGQRDERQPDDEVVGDYSYDEAHDPATRPEKQRPGGPGRAEPVPPSTGDPDPDRDYSYDLAHDVPRPEPGRRT
jgi:hypothetical protein